MNHFDDEVILKYSLEILGADESQQVREHLKECEICSSIFNDIERQNNLIASYNPEIESMVIPINKTQHRYKMWLKRAAVLIIGFLLGYAASILFQPERVVIVEQLFISKSPQVTPANFSACPQIDIYQGVKDI